MQARPQSYRAAMFWSLLILLAVACSGCSTTPTTHQTTPTPPMPTLTPIPTDPSSLAVRPPPFSGALADPPTDCPTAPVLQSISGTNFGGGFYGAYTFYGATPVWGWPGEAGATIHFQDFIGDGGWPDLKNLWVIGANFYKPVTLSGHDLRTNTPLWFHFLNGSAPATYTTSAVLDPAIPNRGSAINKEGRWEIWGIGLVLLQAGCYELDATWDGGTMHTIYALGR